MRISLLRQAVGSEPAREENWENLRGPDTDLLPTVAARLDDGQASGKAKGLRRYTWLRYQLLWEQARRVAALGPDELLLADDLHLASRFYWHPSARVLHGLDFLAARGWDRRNEPALRGLGWEKPQWHQGPGYTEWINGESQRLRFHAHWLYPASTSLVPVLERATTGPEGLRTLSATDQLCRTCWQGPAHLWLLDALTMVEAEPSLREAELGDLACLGWRWSALSRRLIEPGLRLTSTRRAWSPAQWVLALSHRRSGLAGHLLEEVALQLVLEGRRGWPGEWLEAVRKRWSLEKSRQLPLALWRRWRGDFL